MKKEAIDKLPKWINDMDSTHKLVLSDDIDSLFSCVLLQKQFNCEVAFFYDFEAMYGLTRDCIKTERDKIIGVDIALEGANKTFDNHVVKLHKSDYYNELSVNLNILENITQFNYYDKYAGSTVLTILSIYNMLKVNELNDEQLMYIACIDSWYLGYYGGYKAFYKYMDILELDVFMDLFKRKKKIDFDNFKRLNFMNDKIRVYDSEVLFPQRMVKKVSDLFPMLDFNLPRLQIHMKKRFNIPNDISFVKPITKKDIGMNLFSFALTRKNNIKITNK